MMEYIGATGIPVKFDSMPIKDGIDFHFILSFAIDVDPCGQLPKWQILTILGRNPNPGLGCGRQSSPPQRQSPRQPLRLEFRLKSPPLVW